MIRLLRRLVLLTRQAAPVASAPFHILCFPKEAGRPAGRRNLRVHLLFRVRVGRVVPPSIGADTAFLLSFRRRRRAVSGLRAKLGYEKRKRSSLPRT